MNNFYHALPIWLQNLGITGYGGIQYFQRYASPSIEPYKSTEHLYTTDTERLKLLQWSRLQHLIQHAAEHVPFYNALFRKLNIAAIDVTPNNFNQIFPILTKADIARDPQQFHSAAWKKKAIKLFTSGTTGTPLPILSTLDARRINYLFYKKILLDGGCSPRDRSITFAGRQIVKPNEKKAYWRYDRSTNTMYCSSYHLAENTIPSYIDAIEKWNPLYIDTYPSAISMIASQAIKSGRQIKTDLRFILTSSETLTDLQKDQITQAFSCPIIDHYGCTEMCISAWSMGGNYIIQPLYGLTEFQPIDNDVSQVICTGLSNEAMPLFRYSIGDNVQNPIETDNSPFGIKSFSGIDGRMDDYIETPDGKKIGRMDPAFKGVSGIQCAQIHQISIDELVVKLCATSGEVPLSSLKTIEQNIKSRTSDTMRITFQQVGSIPLESSGKFKSVISHIRRPQLACNIHD